jgi:hypothetical protein
MPTRVGARRGALLTILLLAGTACGSSDTAGPARPDDDGGDPPVETVSSLPEGAEDLVGRYAHYDVVAYEDELMKTLIISTGFSDLELRDGELWNIQRFCHADMGNDQNIETTMSDAATSAIVPIDTKVEVTLEDGALRVIRPATPTGIGIEFEDPANDVLPTDPTDPRIVDSDGDGNPGVTAHIKLNDEIEGDLFIARREIFEYDVTQESPDRLVGTITDSSEQLIIDATNPLFLTPAQWVQIDDPARNPVIWQRVSDDMDCEQLAAQRDELFPPNPEADW